VFCVLLLSLKSMNVDCVLTHNWIFCNVLSAMATHFYTLVLFDCACDVDHESAMK